MKKEREGNPCHKVSALRFTHYDEIQRHSIHPSKINLRLIVLEARTLNTTHNKTALDGSYRNHQQGNITHQDSVKKAVKTHSHT